ncbi:MAG: hypothetical protein JJV96_01015 [Alphaproteobacteria bacterium]|nr:hypothetical protein [Alphaproteobacteria bacterium]
MSLKKLEKFSFNLIGLMLASAIMSTGSEISDLDNIKSEASLEEYLRTMDIPEWNDFITENCQSFIGLNKIRCLSESNRSQEIFLKSVNERPIVVDRFSDNFLKPPAIYNDVDGVRDILLRSLNENLDIASCFSSEVFNSYNDVDGVRDISYNNGK